LLICVINRLYTYELAGRLLSIDYNAWSIKKSMGNYSPLSNIQKIPWRIAVATWIMSRLWLLFRILWDRGLQVTVYDIPQCGYTPLKHQKSLCEHVPKQRTVKAYRRCEIWGSHSGADVDSVFRDMTCRLINSNPCFGQACCLLFQVPSSQTLKTEAANCSETSVPIYQSTPCHIPEYMIVRTGDFGAA
jgi:hypothetical protein